MAAKTNGAEFKAYLKDNAAWPEGQWHEDEEIFVNGKLYAPDQDYLKIPDSASVGVQGGYLERKTQSQTELGSMEDHFLAWQTAHTTETFVVTISKSKAAELRAAITAAGGTIQ